MIITSGGKMTRLTSSSFSNQGDHLIPHSAAVALIATTLTCPHRPRQADQGWPTLPHTKTERMLISSQDMA